MAHKDWVIPASGATCPAPMTRAALIALRNSGGLSKDCDYVITDHVQGRLVAGTQIHLQAVDANTLAMHAQVKTTYDNVAWEGRYDIDTGLVMELRDSRNNTVIGANAVAIFDWGNPAYSDCRVEHSTWTVTYGSTQLRQRVRVLDGSTLNTSGMTGGALINVEVSRQSNVNLANGNLTIQNSSITEQSTVNASGYTAGGIGVVRSRIESLASVTFGPGSGVAALQMATVSGQASVSHTGTGAFTFSNGTITGNCVVSHTGAGAFSATGCRVEGTATAVTHADAGQLTMAGSVIGPYGRVLKSGASTGNMTLSYCAIDTTGYVQQIGGGPMSLVSTSIRGASYVRSLAGANTAAGMTLNSCALDSSAAVDFGATAGSLSMTGVQMSSNAFVSKTGAGNLTANYCDFRGGGRVTHTGVRNLTLQYCTVANYGRITQVATGGAGVGDSCSFSSCQDYGVINFAATGAAGNQANYSSVRGLTGEIAFTGTNTGTVVTRTIADNGTMRFDSNTVAIGTVLDNGVRDNGAITVSGCGATQDIRYNTVHSGGRLNLANKAAAGARACYRNTVESQGTLTSQGAAGHVTENYVRQGTIINNGGNLNSASKTQTGTLTTGAFNHSNIQHHVAGNKTLTAANSNRADYQGLTAQLV